MRLGHKGETAIENKEKRDDREKKDVEKKDVEKKDVEKKDVEKKDDKEKEQRINHRIRAKQVRLIGADGEQVGIIAIEDALRRAEEEGLDLVEMAAQANPPVCKLMDYGKFKYAQKQKAKEAKKNATQIQIKEVKLRPKTDEHDIQVKVKHIQRFLEEGDKAKITVQFRGREITHKEQGAKLLQHILDALGEEVIVEMTPRMEGRSMIMMLGPKAKK